MELTILLLLFFFVQFWIGFRIHRGAAQLIRLSSSLDKIDRELENMRVLVTNSEQNATERRTQATKREVERNGGK